jgi:hypothetical protein
MRSLGLADRSGDHMSLMARALATGAGLLVITTTLNKDLADLRDTLNNLGLPPNLQPGGRQ